MTSKLCATFLLTSFVRSAIGARMAEVKAHHDIGSDNTLSMSETKAAKRTAALFREAFPESFLETGASLTCPYGTKGESYVAGTEPFTCHNHLPEGQGRGHSCPELQQKRLKVHRKYFYNQSSMFVNQAATFPLSPLFDKSSLVVGDENYENMIRYHIQGLSHPGIVAIEDKIKLKELAGSLGLPCTKSLYGAHKSDWDPAVFTATMESLCSQGVDDMMIKPTHLLLSIGVKIVRGWQDVCSHPNTLQGNITSLVAFIETEILGVIAEASDAGHLRLLEAGFVMEELFKTGGASTQPLEAKALVLWGKVHQLYLIGSDSRGCQVGAGSWTIFRDGSGWDLGGMAGTTPSDAINKILMEKFFAKLVGYAEAFAQGVGADYTRVDFFLGGFDEGDEPVILLNEVETVSSFTYQVERLGIGSVWRDGYVLRESGIRVTPEKWDRFMDHMEADRAANDLP